MDPTGSSGTAVDRGVYSADGPLELDVCVHCSYFLLAVLGTTNHPAVSQPPTSVFFGGKYI